MLNPVRLRALDLKEPLQAGRPAFISSASGLVEMEGYLFGIADDEECLFRLIPDSDQALEVTPLTNRQLPVEPSARKKLKSDFEALCVLPSLNALLAIPSGSKPQRQISYLISFGSSTSVQSISKVDVSGFYESLQETDLNIEAAFECGKHFLFLNRGNTKDSKNFLVICDRLAFLNEIQTGQLSHLLPSKKVTVELGNIQGRPLAFTDACAIDDDHFLYLASAEDTDSAYDDGVFLGAEIGVLHISGQIRFHQVLSIPEKPEGLCVYQNHIYMVTDADNPTRPSQLYTLPLKSVLLK